MKALTIRQPHVAAIFAGHKAFETRSWRTSYRGRLAIHAAGNLDRAELLALGWNRRGWDLQAQEALETPASATRLAAIVGTVTLVDIVPVEAVPPANRGWDRPWGDFTPGRWAWRVEDPVLLETPVPAAGHLMLWDWDPRGRHPGEIKGR